MKQVIGTILISIGMIVGVLLSYLYDYVHVVCGG